MLNIEDRFSAGVEMTDSKCGLLIAIPRETLRTSGRRVNTLKKTIKTKLVRWTKWSIHISMKSISNRSITLALGILLRLILRLQIYRSQKFYSHSMP